VWFSAYLRRKRDENGIFKNVLGVTVNFQNRELRKATGSVYADDQPARSNGTQGDL
jgi:hypothetical protein